jgi:hypothetical protein
MSEVQPEKRIEVQTSTEEIPTESSQHSVFASPPGIKTSEGELHKLEMPAVAQQPPRQAEPQLLAQAELHPMVKSEQHNEGVPQQLDPKSMSAENNLKRSREEDSQEVNVQDSEQKRVKAEYLETPMKNENVYAEELEQDDSGAELLKIGDDSNGPAPVQASKVGINCFNDYDVLSGRGGGTNVHPGNRNFRDLINLHRRAYLKARKNDKPAISRAIVRSIRENNGRFLKKDEKSGMWYEIGDDAAREKTSQALRQRAPEMRKLLFDTEREEAKAAAEEQFRQQRMMMGMPHDMPNGPMPPGMHQSMAPPMGPGGQPMFPNPALFQAAMANGGKNGMPQMPNMPNGQDPYSQMFSAALIGQGMNRFASNGA